ncbi:MAG: hypothetical protein AB1505_11300 [Candidatus Latescibacterota bacterium]
MKERSRKGKAKGKTKGSLLQRLFGGRKQAQGRSAAPQKKAPAPAATPGKAAGSAPRAAAEAVPPPRLPTPLERSIAEVKSMARIGARDPERLARLLAGLLAKERQQRQAEKERFEQQVLEIARRTGAEPPPAATPPTGAPPGPRRPSR